MELKDGAKAFIKNKILNKYLLTVKGETKMMLGHTFLAYIDVEVKDIELKDLLE